MVLFPGPPTGSCNSRQLALDMSSGSLYTCVGAGLGTNGTWQIVMGGGGGGGAVSSVFTRTGNVVATAGDYSFDMVTGAAPLDTPSFTGIPTAPTAPAGTASQQLATTLFVAQSGVSLPGLSSDGTTLTYTGNGGVVASKFSNGAATGPFQLQSAVGTLPGLPGSGNNALVSGPDGWYISNNNGAYAILGAAGVTSFNSRTGAVLPAANDYNVSQITGAAPLNSPALTGIPTSSPPPANDSSNMIATTQWVKSQGASAPIAHGLQGPVCYSNDTATQSSLAFPGLSIRVGDTVVVGVQTTATMTGTVTTALSDDGGNSYNLIKSQVSGTGSTQQTLNLLGTPVGAAKQASQITVTQTYSGGAAAASKFVMCVGDYINVARYGNSVANLATGTTSTPVTASAVIQDPNGYLFAMSGTGNGSLSATVPAGSGTLLAQKPSSTPVAATGALCENTTATSASINCTFNWNNVSSSTLMTVGTELRPGVTPGNYPAVVAYSPLNVSSTDTSGTTTSTLCATNNCPAGLYNLRYTVITTTACTTGGSVTPSIIYSDEVSTTSPYRTVTLNPMNFTSTNYVSGGLFFSNQGVAPINVFTTGTACTTGGPGAGHMYMTLERLH